MKMFVSMLLSLTLSWSGVLPKAYGAPGHPGPGGPGAGFRPASAPAPHYRHPGPRHGYGLPDGARELWIGSVLYFVAAGTYYLWSAERSRYEPVPEPANGASYDVIAYPAQGQTDDQQARDRYECHSWAVQQSGFDPARAQSAPAESVTGSYRRALAACLQGRGYSVQ